MLKNNKESKIRYYVLPFSIVGGLVALYQWLLQMGIITALPVPCINGVPCDDIYIKLLGFITIPFLSFLAFLFITAVMIASRTSPTGGRSSGNSHE